MMLSVTFGISADVIGSALTGGNPVNNIQVALFQLSGIGKHCDFLHNETIQQNTSSPTITTELLGWKLDIIYSLGMALAFLLSLTLSAPAGLSLPYFDPVVAVLVMVFMLPESIKVLWSAIRDIFLFSPDETLMEEIKARANRSWPSTAFIPVFRHHTNGPPPLDLPSIFRSSAAVWQCPTSPCGGGHQCRGPGAVSELHL